MTPTHPLIFKEAEGGFIPKACAENWVYFPKRYRGRLRGCHAVGIFRIPVLVYAADIALPIVNLRMETDWAPRVVDTSGNRDRFGWWVRVFEWFSIVAGWVSVPALCLCRRRHYPQIECSIDLAEHAAGIDLLARRGAALFSLGMDGCRALDFHLQIRFALNQQADFTGRRPVCIAMAGNG